MPTGKGGDGNIQYCTITTVDESPLVPRPHLGGHRRRERAGDEGRRQELDEAERQDHGQPRLLGERAWWRRRTRRARRTSRTRASATTTSSAFVYKTTDYGQTWTSIVGNLPAKSVNVIREDPYNPNLLFVGVDFGLYVTIDGGKTWQEMKNGLPTQPVLRPEDPPARARPDRRHARARHLHHRHLGARRRSATRRSRRTSTCSTSSRR